MPLTLIPVNSFLTRYFGLTILLSVSCCISSPGYGHDVDVTGIARVLLDEVDENTYELSVMDLQAPPIRDLNASIPDKCQAMTFASGDYRFQCNTALNSDDNLELPWSLEGVVVLARWIDGSGKSAYFRGNSYSIDIPLSELQASAGSSSRLAWQYLQLGIEHIVFGIDHLLFVFGLLLLLGGPWQLVKTITAFTIAHSITLALAVLGYVNADTGAVESIIALSIVLLAREIICGLRGEKGLAHAAPWLVAFIFGLFHGLGFASALGELGLRSSDIPWALLFFNLGVEAGQLAFVAVLYFLYQLFKFNKNLNWPALQTGLAYGLGGIATYWFFQRLPAVLPML